MERRRDARRSTMPRFANYVRPRRKHWLLSQRELAFLLGLSSQAVVSQHESLARLPQTKVLIKYELLFGEPVSVLFPKLHRDACAELAAQAKVLMRRLEKRSDRPSVRKLELLQAFILRLEQSP